MRKAIFSVILIFSTVSCAAFMEDFGNGEYNEALQQTAVILALTSKPAIADDLLLSLYYYSLINRPAYQTRRYNYLPTWKDVFYEDRYKNALLDYEYKLQEINRMETWKLEMEVQRLIDDLKRAKED
jgi:hypothetical protein